MSNKQSIKHVILATAMEIIVREMIEHGKSYITSKTSIDIGEYNYDMWQRINRELFKLSPEKYSGMRVPTQNKEYYELEVGAQLTIHLSHKNWITVCTYKDTNSSGILSEKRMTIKFRGPKKYRNRLSFIRKLMFPERDKIEITCNNGDGSITTTTQSNGFDSIIMPKSQKDYIVNGLSIWKNSRQWYEDRGLVYKIGVLLYGAPGTGKSSVAKAISKLFHNAPIISIHPSHISESIERIIRTRRRINGTLVVLIEDFDMFCHKRGETCNNEEAEKSLANQNLLFQLLDGVYSTDDTIYIATTNHIDRVDPAFIRPGRFDIRTELIYFNREQAKEFIVSFQCPEYADILNAIEDDLIQPALLQSEIMRVRAEILNGGKSNDD